MPLIISRLRRWFALGAIVIAAMVAGAYFYAHWRFSLVPTPVPNKINLQVQQTAQGFTISKSEQGRTIFTIRASNAVQYKQGGHAELHDVKITVYGRDAQRFDQIYGADFDYDPQSGTVVAQGEVQIDLESNPAGLTQPDQAAPRELKNPIHLKTSALVFNQKTGDASTAARVDFTVAEAKGSAVGATYTGTGGVLDLKSKVNMVLTGSTAASLDATHAVIRKDSRQIELHRPRIFHGPEQLDSDHGTLFLRPNNTLDHALAIGKVHIQVHSRSAVDAHSERAELFMNEQPNTLHHAILSGNVQMNSTGPQPADATAGRVTLNFSGRDLLTTARAEENVKLVQHHATGSQAITGALSQKASAQDIEVTAPVVDFVVNHGRRLQSARTSGAAQIDILPADSTSGPHTTVTAARFNAKFDDRNRLSSVYGAPDAKIVNSTPGQPDRVSSSNVLDVAFLPAGGIASMVQQGSVAYVDANLNAWGDRARYTPADQMLYLSGSPRVVEGGMTTTAHSMRMNRATGDAFADDNVKSTYSELKPQPNGALLASSDPIHVTARNMVLHRSSALATYTGNVRLWQVANVVEAPRLEFDRERRSVVAFGAVAAPVSTVLIQTDEHGNQTPVTIASDRLTYTDNERKAHFEGNVVTKAVDGTMTAKQVDVYLRARDQSPTQAQSTTNQPLAGASKVEKIIADGNVVIVQPVRRAQGNHLVYTAPDDKYVLTGGPPSIFDAEHGKVTGVSLTFYKRDDRVLVEGDTKSPTVTQTRVAR